MKRRSEMRRRRARRTALLHARDVERKRLGRRGGIVVVRTKRGPHDIEPIMFGAMVQTGKVGFFAAIAGMLGGAFRRRPQARG